MPQICHTCNGGGAIDNLEAQCWEDCPDCNGWGYVTIERDEYDPYSGHRNRKEDQECDRCNGRGEILIDF